MAEYTTYVTTNICHNDARICYHNFVSLSHTFLSFAKILVAYPTFDTILPEYPTFDTILLAYLTFDTILVAYLTFDTILVPYPTFAKWCLEFWLLSRKLLLLFWTLVGGVIWSSYGTVSRNDNTVNIHKLFSFSTFLKIFYRYPLHKTSILHVKPIFYKKQ